jgi:hypothetical protein
MKAFSEYMDKNRERAYAVAISNTKYNEQGRPIISKDDDWVNETEWDDLFNELI